MSRPSRSRSRHTLRVPASSHLGIVLSSHYIGSGFCNQMKVIREDGVAEQIDAEMSSPIMCVPVFLRVSLFFCGPRYLRLQTLYCRF